MRRPQRKASIGGKEMTALLTILVASHVFLNYPRLSSQTSAEAAWVEPIAAGVIALVVVCILDWLFRRGFAEKGLPEVVRERMGRFGAGLVGIVFAVYFLTTTSSLMRQFMENVVTTVLPHTPIYLVGGLFAATIVYIAFCGLEGIARVGFVALPVLVIGVLAVCLLTKNAWQPELLLPIWGRGLPSIIWGSLISSSLFINIVLLCIVRAHIHDPKDFRSIGIRSTIYAALLLAAFLVVYHMVFTPNEAIKLTSPMYSVARIIHLGRFFQRLESVFIFMWVSAAVVKMSITLWAGAYCLGVGFNWPTYRPILPALGLLCLAGSLLPSDIATVVELEDLFINEWGWVVSFLFPMVVLWLASMFRAKRRAV